MKFFVGFLFVAVSISAAVCASIGESSKQGLQPTAAAENVDSLRIRKAAYGLAPAAPAPAPGLAISGIPCPKNYLFSCQPQLQPVACGGQPAAPAAAFGQGAYSEFIPQWVPHPQEM